MRDGKEVDTAKVFVTGNGTRFIAYLERAVDDPAKAEIEKLRQQADEQVLAHPTAPSPELQNQITANLEVKKPGDGKWFKATSTQGEQVRIVTCPDGSNPELAVP